MLFRRNVISIDTFTSPQALEAVAGRRQLVVETGLHHGLTGEGKILIGGGGLALQGADAYSQLGNETSFDFDTLVIDAEFARLQALEGAISRPHFDPTEVDLPRTDTTLPVTGLIPRDEFMRSFRAETFEELHERTIEIDGIRTLPAGYLAWAKLGRGEVRDVAGIIKSHAVVTATDNPISRDPLWRQEIASACRLATQRARHRNRAVRKSLPCWLGRLIDSDFDHPSFRSLDFNPDRILRPAS